MMYKPQTFEDFLEEIIYQSEITEIPGVTEARADLIKEMWQRWPDKCKAIGLTDGLKENA